MKKNTCFLIIAAAALAFSCSKEMSNQTAKPEQQNAGQTFYATMEVPNDPSSKATFTDGINWEPGDEIAVSDGTTTSIFVATYVDNKTGKATFALKNGQPELKTLDQIPGGKYRAWYPTSIAPDSEGNMIRPQLSLNTNGEGGDVNLSPSIYADNPMYCETNTNTLSFKNLCGYLKIIYDDENAGYALHYQIFESLDKLLWGPYTINEFGEMVITPETGSRRSELRNTNAKFVSQGGKKYVTTYYYAIPAGTYNSLSFMPITNTNSTTPRLCQIIGLKPGHSITVERNKVYTIQVTLNDMRTDLSYNLQTANCYAFAKKGNYMFRATKGNEKNIISGIDHADVVWRAQTWESTGAGLAGKIVNNVSYKSGYITFDANGSQANALIAAYDAGGKVLWSWHIWSLNSERPLEDVTINGVTMQDRNLGALYATAYHPNDSSPYTTSVLSSGYLYQWGRKDPFPGRGQEGSAGALIKMFDKNGSVLNTTEGSGDDRAVALPLTAGPVTLAESVEHAGEFINVSSGLWVSGATGTWSGDKKTIYDPCPYGYRVAAKDDFVKWDNTSVTPYVALRNEEVTSLHGFTYTDGTNSTFFPLTGQANNSTGTLSGAYMGSNSKSATSTYEAFSRLWTRDSNQTFVQARAAIAGGNKTWEDKTFSYSKTAFSGAHGMAVRCVKETTE